MSIHKKKNKGKRAKIVRKGKRKVARSTTRGYRIRTRRNIAGLPSVSSSSRLWPEEERALEDIHTGRTKMVDISGEDFLKEIKSVINEQPTNTA